MISSKISKQVLNNYKHALNTSKLLVNNPIRLESTTNPTPNEEINFGFKKVKYEDKQGKVNEVFNNVAEKYDLMNDAMSFGLHRLWKNTFINDIEPNNQMKLIDVAGGTGDITFRFLSSLKSKYGNLDSFNESNKVTVCDINENMLNVGKERSKNLGFYDKIDWKVGNAEKLVAEKDNTYDVYTIAFGIRNCTNLENVVREAYRVLKPGGRFMCMEFSRTKNPVFEKIYDVYSFRAIPVMGYLLAGDWNSYQYLVESIRMFPSQEEFAGLISNCGFKLVNFKNLANGAVAIHTGYKF